jgi:hypothetical protein
MQIVDRRLNPKAKSLGNRQAYAAPRARSRGIKDCSLAQDRGDRGAEKVTIRSKSLREPSGRAHRPARLRAAWQREYKVGDDPASGRRRRPAARVALTAKARTSPSTTRRSSTSSSTT